MRFPEDKIKEAILHPDLEIRDRATSYFAKSYSQDPSLMAQVIKAVETYGRQDAYLLIGLSRDLPQTEESIAWVIDELNDDQSAGRELHVQPVDGPGRGRYRPAPAQRTGDSGSPLLPPRPACGLHRASADALVG